MFGRHRDFHCSAIRPSTGRAEDKLLSGTTHYGGAGTLWFCASALGMGLASQRLWVQRACWCQAFPRHPKVCLHACQFSPRKCFTECEHKPSMPRGSASAYESRRFAKEPCVSFEFFLPLHLDNAITPLGQALARIVRSRTLSWPKLAARFLVSLLRLMQRPKLCSECRSFSTSTSRNLQ